MFPSRSTLLRCWFALSIALTPMLPAFASVHVAVAHGAHASHADAFHGGAESAAHPAAPTPAKHAHCDGHCCIGCGLSTVTIGAFATAGDVARPVQVPIVTALHPHALVNIPLRPPRSLS
jgi:hypothetical protein